MTKLKDVQQLEAAQSSIQNAREALDELGSADPYVVDAQAFLTQAKVMLGKQLQLRGVKPKDD